MMHSAFETAKHTARGLRKLQRDPERKLWSVLRNRQFLGKKFYRQHPMIIGELGMKVVRFKNDEVEDDIERVEEKLRSLISNG